MSAYRIGAPSHRRACSGALYVNPLRGARRRLWAAALYYFTPADKARRAADFRAILAASLGASGTFANITDRMDCAIVDRALRGAWMPVQGDA